MSTCCKSVYVAAQALSPAELKAGYRFFDNDLVDTDGVLAAHIAQALRRMKQIR